MESGVPEWRSKRLWIPEPKQESEEKMKKTVSRIMVVILAALSLVSASLMAQSRFAMRMKIPFSFVAGEKAFPAGEYTIQTGGSVANTVWIRSQDASTNLVLLSHAALAKQPVGESWL